MIFTTALPWVFILVVMTYPTPLPFPRRLLLICHVNSPLGSPPHPGDSLFFILAINPWGSPADYHGDIPLKLLLVIIFMPQ